VQPSVAFRRLAYRSAYALLRLYWFALRPTLSGVKCLLTDGDRVLLVRHTYGPRGWELPGGGFKRDEAPAAAARRETHEELGVWIEDWVDLGKLPATMNHREGSLHCFQASVREPPITIDLGELAVARWFRRHELPPDLGRYVEPILSRARV
jgi:8-oxo-dGTP pyrophosphatase MutT (NUDIX family)